jgi:dienelactone hydrolase
MFKERFEAWARLVDDLAVDVIKQKASNSKVGLVSFSNGGILATGASIINPRNNAAVIYYGTEPLPPRTSSLPPSPLSAASDSAC